VTIFYITFVRPKHKKNSVSISKLQIHFNFKVWDSLLNGHTNCNLKIKILEDTKHESWWDPWFLVIFHDNLAQNGPFYPIFPWNHIFMLTRDTSLESILQSWQLGIPFCYQHIRGTFCHGAREQPPTWHMGSSGIRPSFYKKIRSVRLPVFVPHGKKTPQKWNLHS
jgi:hypothetical protein